jgi:hypothetical protein
MAGQISKMLRTIIEKRSQGNPTLMSTTKTKLVLKGLNPDNFGPNSPDDPALLGRVKEIAVQMGVAL